MKNKIYQQKIKINKKASGGEYFALAAIFMMIFSGLVTIVISSPLDDIAKDIEFGNTIKQADLTTSTSYAVDAFLKSTQTTIGEKKDNLIQAIALGDIQSAIRSGSDCKIKDLNLWYDQREDIKENTESTEEEELSEDETDVDTSKTQDSKNINNDKQCKPNFEENLDEKIVYYYDDLLQDHFENGLNSIGMNLDELDITFQENKLDVKLQASHKSTSQFYNIGENVEYDTTYDLGTYMNLINLMDKVIIDMPAFLYKQVPICLAESELREDECITQSIDELIKSKSSSFKKAINDYIFNIRILDSEEFERDEYYAVEFIINNKITQKEELKFGVVLKDNIPYSLINFNLKEFTGYDNVVSAIIDKPSFSVLSYVLLYSYEDFFNKEFSGYSNLLKSLKNSEVPKKFLPGKSDSFQNKYYYSAKELGGNVNLMVINSKDFVQNNEIDQKEVKIYQIYDFELEEYVPLDNSRLLYTYVFAVDKNYNYNIADIEGRAKNIPIKSQFGPIPLTQTNLKANGNVPDLERTMNIQVNAYNDEKFDHYDLYIIEKGGVFSEKCNEQTNEKLLCHYYNGADILTNLDLTARVTSVDNLEQKEGIKLIESKDFTNSLTLDNFNLEDSNFYTLYVIPTDKSSSGITKSLSSSWKLKKQTTTESVFYDLVKDNDNIQYKPFPIKDINIMDKKAPTKNSVFFQPGNEIKYEATGIYLNFNSVILNDVVALKATVEKYNSIGLSSVASEYISIDTQGKIPASVLSTSTTKIIIKNIYPVDDVENTGLEALDYSFECNYDTITRITNCN